jgi:ribosomal protein L19E
MSPPYADPLAKSYWEATHRKERGERYLRAVRWAREQMKMLRQQGVVHTREEWKRLLLSLIHSYLESGEQQTQSS